MEKQNSPYLALALDNCESSGRLAELIEQTKEHVGVFKVGLEQYVRFGPTILDAVRTAHAKIFLDLKLYDIPNTVGKAVKAASAHEVDYLTIHVSGGTEMMQAAAEAAAGAENPPKLLGVTVLTSIDQECLNRDLRVAGTVLEQVRNLADLAVCNGLAGIVCSAADLPGVKPGLPPTFEIVTPGIRPVHAGLDDQKRVATPREALRNGATILVVGRPITTAANPREAARHIAREIEEAAGE